ncbi:MAG: D-alanyl-D-alanine carboxypeptidase family protein [Coprococcus sp.]
MKKIFSFLVICCILCSILQITVVCAAEVETDGEQTVSSEPETEAVPVILPTDKVSTENIILYSSACCVMDADTGEILYYKNMDEKHYPASITKVLTGLLLIENAALDETITFSQDCWEGLNYYNDMNIGILDGEQLSVEAALHAILLSSANEVCNGAAEYISGSVQAFCDMMNERAEALGCTNTNFVNPNGLHDKNHYTTAHDMALIARAAIQNPAFRKITGTYEYPVESTNLRPEGFVLGHKHRMLMYTNYHYNACIGGKTGYTEEAKNTLVTYAEKNGMTLVCVVMENSDGHIYPDTIQALDYCFDNYEKLNSGLNSSDVTVRSAAWTPLPFEGFDIDSISCVSDHTGDIIISKDSSVSSLSQTFHAADNFTNLAPYRTALCHFGTIIYTQEDGQTAGSQPLYTSIADIDTTALEEAAVSVPVSNDADIPTFIQLTDDNEVSDIAVSDLSDDLIQSLMPFLMNHLMIVIPVLIAVFFLLTLFLVWLRRILKRRHHRRNYERLRNERMKNDIKNN